MDIGMLWFDNGNADLKTRIERAAAYYRTKYGKTPNLCFVNPLILGNQKILLKYIQVKSCKTIQMNHFWMGNEEPKK